MELALPLQESQDQDQDSIVWIYDFKDRNENIELPIVMFGNDGLCQIRSEMNRQKTRHD